MAARRRKGLAATSSEEADEGGPRSAVDAGPNKSGYSGARDRPHLGRARPHHHLSLVKLLHHRQDGRDRHRLPGLIERIHEVIHVAHQFRTVSAAVN